jgi:hypothetical protein
VWFRVILVLPLFVLLVSLGEQVRLLIAPQEVQRPSSYYDSTDTHAVVSTLSFEQTIAQAQHILGPRTTLVKEENTAHLCAGRRTWARAGTALLFLGLLVLVGGLAVESRAGWKQSEIRVLPYEDVSLGPDGSLQLRLLDIQAADDGSEAQLGSTANLQVASQTVLPVQLGVPVRHRTYRYLWVSKGGPSVRLRASRVSDPERPLTLYEYAVRPQPAQSLQFSFALGQDSDHQFIVSEDKTVGWLHWEENDESAGTDSPDFQLWLFDVDGQELGVESFRQIEGGGDTDRLRAVIGDTSYDLQVSRYIVLDIAHQPGRWLFWLGGALLALGGAGLAIPRATIWAQISAGGDQVVLKAREETAGLSGLLGKRARTTVTRLRSVLTDSEPNEQTDTRQRSHDRQSLQNPTTHRKNL